MWQCGPAVDNEQSNASLLDRRRSQHLTDKTQCASRVGRRRCAVRRRQTVQRTVVDAAGEIEHEPRPVRERDETEARQWVETDDQRLAVFEDSDHVQPADTRRRVDRQDHVHSLSACCTRTYRHLFTRVDRRGRSWTIAYTTSGVGDRNYFTHTG